MFIDYKSKHFQYVHIVQNNLLTQCSSSWKKYINHMLLELGFFILKKNPKIRIKSQDTPNSQSHLEPKRTRLKATTNLKHTMKL